MIQTPDFYPQSPILEINIISSKEINSTLEWDVIECLSYEEKPGNWFTEDNFKFSYEEHKYALE